MDMKAKEATKMTRRKETSPKTITIIGADGSVSYVEPVYLKDMTDEEIFSKANADRASGLGQHDMTIAMQEELRRRGSHHSGQIYDE